jgi:lipopolysaccharide biosynthesis glycosyltransferase
VSSIAVGCAADESYALPLAVMLRSAELHLAAGASLDVYAVDGGLSGETRERVARSLGDRVRLRWVAPERSAFSGLPLWGRMPVATYDKLAIGSWVPPEVERVIWLDADLLVLGDLGELAAVTAGAALVHAVRDERVPTVGSRFGIAGHAALGFRPDAGYFNAGVLAIDLSRWRAEDVAGRALAYLRDHRDAVYFWDQEALNAALRDRWAALPAEWNRQAGLAPAAAASEARILHFSGYLKPWIYRSSRPTHELYLSFVDRTAWTGSRPTAGFGRRALSLYESSQLRRFALPLERFALSAVRAATYRYASASELERPLSLASGVRS